MTTTMQDMSSADATAIIDSALLNAQTTGSLPTGTDESILSPGPLPIETEDAMPKSDDEKLTPEQKKQKAADEKQKAADEKLRKAKEDMLGKEQAEALRKAQEEEEERQKTLTGTLEKFLASGKQKSDGVSAKIASLPTPGNIAVPLVVLLVFFFILIQYGNNTRLQWLWLVLTNNAYISASLQNATAGATGGGQPNPVQEAPPIMLTLPTFRIAQFAAGGIGEPY